MLKNGLTAVLIATTALGAAPALADDAAAAYSTSTSKLGTLLDNPATKAVLAKYIPQIITNPQIDAARGMTLKQLQTYIASQLPDATLAKIDADFTRLSAPR